MATRRGNARWALAVTTLLVVALAIAVAIEALRRPAVANRLCSMGVGLLGRQLGLATHVDRCRIDPLDARLRLKGLRAVDRKNEADVVTIDSIEVRLRPLQSLAGGLWVERLVVSGVSVAWPGTREKQPQPPTLFKGPCWTRVFKLFHVEDLEVEDAKMEADIGGVHVALAGVAARSLLEKGVYRGTLEAGGEVTLEGGHKLPVRRASASFELDPRHDRLEVTSAGVDADRIRLSAHGEARGLCHPVFDLYFNVDTSVATLAELAAPGVPGAKGTLSISGRWNSEAAGRPLSLETRLSGAELAGYRLGDVRASTVLDDKGLRIDPLRLALDEGGEAVVQGRVELSGRYPVTLDVAIHHGDLPRTLDRAQIQHCLVDLKFDGKAHLTGHLLGSPSFNGDTEGDIDGLVVNNWGWDRPVARQVILAEPSRLHLTSGIRIDSERFRFEHAHVRGGDSDITADASIYYDAKRGLRLKAEATRLSLTDLKQIAGLPWSGQGTATLDIAGPYSGPLIQGHADFQDFHFFRLDLGHVTTDVRSHGSVLEFPILFGVRGRTGYSGSGSIDFDRDFWIEGDIDVSTGRLEDLTAAIQSLEPSLPAVHEALAGVFSGHGHIKGPLLHADAKVDLDLGDFTIFDRAVSHGAISAHLEKGQRVVVDSVAAQTGTGHLSGEGTVGIDGALALRATVQDVPIGPLLQPDGSEPPARGQMDLEGTLTGTLADWRPGGSAVIRDFDVLGIPLGTARLRFATRERHVELSGAAGDEETIRGDVELHRRGPYTALVSGATDHLETYLKGYGFRDPPAGALEGTLSLKGDILDPQQSTGEFDIGRLVISRGALRVENEGEVRIGLDGASLDFRELALRGTNTQLRIVGTRDANGSVHASANGKLDARLLEGLVPHVERLGGVLEARADIRGSWTDPSIIGTAAFHHGQFVWSGWPLNVRELEGSAQFSQRKVVIDHAHADLNGGTIDLGGEVRLRGFELDRCDLDSTLKHVPLRIPEAIPSVVSGRIALFGGIDEGLVMGGDLNIERARYTRDLEIDQLVNSWRSHVRAAPFRAKSTDAPMRFDLRLHGDGDLRVDSDFAQLRLEGDLQVVGNSDSVGLLGSVGSKDGLVEFRGNQYHLTDVSFTFSASDRIAPSFDVTADTDTRQYRVFVHAYGTPGDYKLSLRSQPALSEDDIIKLLTFGVTSRDTASNIGTAGEAGFLGDVLWNISGLKSEVKKIIPRNPLIKDFSFNVGSAFLESVGQVEPVAQIESRVLTDALHLRAQVPLSEYAGKRAEAEYQLTDHMSLQGDWNNDYSDYNVGDFGLDLRMRWEFGK
jgi:translocation and assembly module TamB